MARFALASLPVFLLALCGNGQEPNKSADVPDELAQRVVARALKAHGPNPVSRWKCGSVNWLSRGGIVPRELEGAIVEDRFQLPGHTMRTVRKGDMVLLVFVINDGKGWTKNELGQVREIDSDATKKTEHLFAPFTDLSPLTQKDVKLTRLKPEKVGERDCIVVRAESAEYLASAYYFDRETGLLMKTRRVVQTNGDDEITEVLLEQYKDNDGGPVPMRIRTYLNGNSLMDVELLQVRFRKTLDDVPFARPK